MARRHKHRRPTDKEQRARTTAGVSSPTGGPDGWRGDLLGAGGTLLPWVPLVPLAPFLPLSAAGVLTAAWLGAGAAADRERRRGS